MYVIYFDRIVSFDCCLLFSQCIEGCVTSTKQVLLCHCS
jgi:hypothetical protein